MRFASVYNVKIAMRQNLQEVEVEFTNGIGDEICHKSENTPYICIVHFRLTTELIWDILGGPDMTHTRPVE